MKNGRNTLMFFIFLLSAIVVGGLISELTRDVSFLSWLSYGQTLWYRALLAADGGPGRVYAQFRRRADP